MCNYEMEFSCILIHLVVLVILGKLLLWSRSSRKCLLCISQHGNYSSESSHGKGEAINKEWRNSQAKQHCTDTQELLSLIFTMVLALCSPMWLNMLSQFADDTTQLRVESSQFGPAPNHSCDHAMPAKHAIYHTSRQMSFALNSAASHL